MDVSRNEKTIGMKILKSITISGLFGTFNHSIEFPQGNDVTILLGQNGIGKTAILRLINMFFNHQLSKLTEISFKNAVISFVDGDEINIDLLKGSIDNVLDYDIKYNDSFMEAVSCSQIADRVRDALRNIRGYISENYKNDEDVLT